MTIFEQAIIFAAQKHSGMTRKIDGSPYILHPLEVVLIVSGMTDDDEVLAAAVLHDTVEDTETGLGEIRALFGSRVAALVASETEEKRPGTPKSESWRVRKAESLSALEKADDPAVKLIWLGDKLSNLRSIYRGWQQHRNGIWKLFNQTDPAQHAWYYRSIDRLLSDLSRFDAWKEFHELVELVFSEVPPV